MLDHVRQVLLEQPNGCTYRFLEDGEPDPVSLSNAALDRHARAIAMELRRRVGPGARVLVVSPPGLDYVACFLGCLYAGVIAVPVYPPAPPYPRRALDRLAGVVHDARPSVVLAPASVVALSDRLVERCPGLAGPAWVAVDEVPDLPAESWKAPAGRPDDIAFLQYTSGSTSRPKGVAVTHANLLHNLAATHDRFFGDEEDPDRHLVVWLPPYHDMGLVGGLLQPLQGRFPVTLMSPMSFIRHPLRWLHGISRQRATVSGGPSFAYDLCVRRFRPEDCTELDLSTWRLAFNGAEPVRAATLESFARTFAPYGFRREAFYPCYGLAETTLMATGADRTRGPVVRHFDASALGLGSARPSPTADSRTVTLVSSGRSIRGQQLLVVDPVARTVVPDGTVGEIWLRGPSIAAGYWSAPAATEEAFGATVAGGDGTRHLRTGDLGVVDAGELFVTGRIKDLLVVGGRNHYPQDIEQTVERSHPALRPGCGVACSVTVDDEERLLVAYEVTGTPTPATADEIVRSVRRAVADEHDLQVHDVVLVRPGGVPKTSSGKLQRSACGAAYLDGTLRVVRHDASPVATPAPGPEPVLRSQDPARLEEWLVEQVARRARVPASAVDTREVFASFGLGSVDLVGLLGELEQRLGRTVPVTVFWEHPTIDALARHLALDEATSTPLPGGTAPVPATTDVRPVAGPLVTAARPTDARARPTEHEPIAIIGIGCRFPGDGDGPTGFWRLLDEGRDAIREVPPDRWSVEELVDDDPTTPGRTTTRWGGFLDTVDGFEPQFFGISPREAAQMDPQQRILAEVVWEALEDAGLPAHQLEGTATGVFIGIATSDYGQLAVRDLTAIDAFTGTGNASSISANRLSYLLDLRGPSMAIDTACSSSLVAVHQACRSLADGDCTVAIAGGVNVILSPALAINFSKAGAMAGDGRCKAFDARADGYVRAEGAGVVLLKPLRQAVADGDRVYATIRGGAVNQDGRTNGLMAPNPAAQEAVLRAAYARAGVDPSSVGYVEAHGTGTLLGDPIEAKALAAVLGVSRSAGRPLLVGSVKTNIGHLEAAAGVAGLIKAALVLHHRHVPASLHYERPNPHIAFADLGLRVAATATPWPAADPGTPVVAGVSSFGFGGTNAHLVLEAAPHVAPPSPPAADTHVLPVSARNDAALRALAGRYAERLASTSNPSEVEAVCRTAATRRTHHDRRLVCVGSTGDELSGQLLAFARGDEAPGLHGPARRVGTDGRVAFVFSGQGPRWWPLGRDLLAAEPAFGAVVERSEAWLTQHVGWSLTGELTADESRSRLGETAVGQPALVAVQVAIAAAWRSRGVEPTTVVGHSVGEVAAACVAGALRLEDALHVALHRGRAIEAAVGRGGMAAVGLSLDDARDAVTASGVDQVWVSASNGPTTSVLSGAVAQLQHVAALLEQRGVFVRLLEKVHFASHCPQMDPLLDSFRSALAGLVPRPTTIPMVSTVTTQAVDGTSLGASYWATNLREPVLFDPAVQALLASGVRTFVEVSAHPMLGHALEERLALDGRPAVVVPSLDRTRPGPRTLVDAAARLHCAGHAIDWRLRHGTAGPPADLPTYPWERERHWLTDAPRHDARPAGPHPLLGPVLHAAGGARASHWTGHVDTVTHPWLADHQVAGSAVLPASAVLDLVTAAARDLLGEDDVVLTDVALTGLVPVPERAPDATIQLVLHPDGGSEGGFRLFSAAGPGEWEDAAHGRYGVASPRPSGTTLTEARTRCPLPLDVAEHHRRLAVAGLRYGPAFRGLVGLWRGSEHTADEAVGELHVPEGVRPERPGHAVHPALLDACLQVVAAAVHHDSGTPATYLPVCVDEVRLRGVRAVPAWAHASVPAGPRTSEGTGGLDGVVVTLYDADGEVVGVVDGLRLHRVGEESTTPPLLTLGWSPDPGPAPSPAVGDDDGWWLVLDDASGLADGLATALGGDRVVAVRPGGPPCADRGAKPRTVRPDRAADWDDLLGVLAAERAGACRGVVHAWALDLAAGDAATDDDLTQARDLACLSTVLLVQALARTGWSAPPRLVLLTRGAQDVDGGDVSTAQAPLWGLARVLELEHPELAPTVVDLPPDGAPVVDDLVAELRSGRGGRQLALRAGAWWVPRLVPRPRTVADDAWQERDLGPGDSNVRVLAARPGALESVGPTAWFRRPPGPGEVELEVEAAGLNFSDVLKAMDACPGVPPGRTPLGAECAGRVVAVGADVTGVRPGDAVVAIAESSLSRFTVVNADLAVRAPRGLSAAQAAAVPIAFLTATYGLEHLARLGAGETVLIHSATGGVGMAALQVARRCGATVLATAGSEPKRELLRTLGVEHVMDSRSAAFAHEVLEHTGGRGVDVVLNSLAGPALTRSLSVLATNGRFVEIGKQDVYDDSRLGLLALRGNRSFLAVDVEALVADRPRLAGELLARIVDDLERGDLAPLPVTPFGYSRAVDAFTHMARARHTGKVVLHPDEVARVAAPAAAPVRPDVTYLVTGGLGDLGLHACHVLVDRGARHLVVVGRTAPDARREAELDEVRARGADVRVRQADVADAAAVETLVAEIGRSMPRLAGVVHVAGALADRSVLNLDRAGLDAVWDGKVRGAWNLHRATRGHDLDLFVLYSSAAALLGSPGQANYALANAFLDALAVHRTHHGDQGLAIAWGPWSQIGLAARQGRDAALAGQGLTALSPAAGAAALHELVAARGHVAVLPHDPSLLGEAALTGMLPPLLRGLVREQDPGDDTATVDVRAHLLAVEPGRRRVAVLVEHCVGEVARVLRLDPDQVSAVDPLSGMGFDSLMSLELRRRLERSLDVTLPATLAWKYPTIEAMVPFLAERIEVDLTGAPGAPAPSAAPAPPPGGQVGAGGTAHLDRQRGPDADDLDDLTADELEGLLLTTMDEIPAD